MQSFDINCHNILFDNYIARWKISNDSYHTDAVVIIIYAYNFPVDSAGKGKVR